MIKKSDLHDLADDNTITAIWNQLADLIKILEAEEGLSVRCFRKSEMVVNSDKFQAIILNMREVKATHKLIMDNMEIKTTNLLELLGINIDDQSKFIENISILCSKAAL